MQERIIEIIVFVLEEFKTSHTEENYVDISKNLMSRGYTESEINLAFSWIFDHLQRNVSPDEEEFHYQENSIRVLHDLEKMVIEPDAYGYLLQLLQLGLISETDMEDVIEKALSLGSTRVTLEDMKAFTSSLIFNRENPNSLDGFFMHPGTNTIH
ncbi:MAG TPA: DUF494 family protein [Caldithrix abyssi]|uniref:DUF494 family protein n=1 Tax=Caldithrix abyssi TaxID=187145 RepID=A0A7V1LN80_CALAY|nr:DUF494 family protein [Caldithrix abyssi]